MPHKIKSSKYKKRVAKTFTRKYKNFKGGSGEGAGANIASKTGTSHRRRRLPARPPARTASATQRSQWERRPGDPSSTARSFLQHGNSPNNTNDNPQSAPAPAPRKRWDRYSAASKEAFASLAAQSAKSAQSAHSAST